MGAACSHPLGDPQAGRTEGSQRAKRRAHCHRPRAPPWPDPTGSQGRSLWMEAAHTTSGVQSGVGVGPHRHAGAPPNSLCPGLVPPGWRRVRQPPTPNPAPGQWRGWVTSVGCELRGSRPCREGITGLELSAGYLLSSASLLSEFVSPCVNGSVSWAQNYRLTQVPLVARSNPRKGPEFNSGNEREGRRSGSLGPAPPNSSLERPLRGAARGVSPCQVSQECVGPLTRAAVMRRRAPLTCLSQSGRTATPRTRVLY